MTPITDTNKKLYLFLTIANTVLCIPLLIVSFGMAMASLMSNDSGQLSENYTLLLIASSFAFPFVILVSMILFWIFYVKRSGTWWMILSSLPWLYCLLIALLVYSAY